MTEAEFKSKVFEWLRSKSKKGEALISNETKILEEKIISSLQIMDLVLFLEKLTGRKTELSALKPASFQSVDSITAAFFKMG